MHKGYEKELNVDQQGATPKKLDTLVWSKLLEVSLPKEISEIDVSDGVVLLRVNGEFKVLLTLGYQGYLSMWRILHMELLVGERSGSVKVENSRIHALVDDLERRMAASESPFTILYSILHELCVALTLEIVIRQVQTLHQGRWKDAIRFELIPIGTVGRGNQGGESDMVVLRTPGLKIIYWLELHKKQDTSDTGASPSIKIELGIDLQIKCSHSTFVIDPQTGKKANFNLDPSCIDVEMLLLRAISCNRHTRLLEIYMEAEKNIHFNRTAGDVQLKFHMDDCETDNKKRDTTVDLQKCDGEEVLLVRAYGSLFFNLGINIRNGHFYIRSSKSIISSKKLLKCEEALNQGSITAAKAFTNLRKNSILHLFACIGKFLGLEVYEHGLLSVKLPKTVLDDPDSLFMGFPECGSSYFLLMQLDNEFKLCPKLLEAQTDSSGSFEPYGRMSTISRIKNLDISQMHMCGGELSLSLLDRQKILPIPNDANANVISEHGLPTEFTFDSIHLRSNAPMKFSSIVEEFFELEKVLNGQSTFSSVLFPASNSSLLSTNIPHKKPSTLAFNLEGPQAWQNPQYKSLVQSASTNSLTTNVVKSQEVKAPKLDQNLAALRSSHSGGSSSAFSGSNSWVASSILSTLDPAVHNNSNQEGSLLHDREPRKRTASDVSRSIPSLCHVGVNKSCNKRIKTQVMQLAQLPSTQTLGSHPSKIEGLSLTELIAEANKGNASHSIYVYALVHIVRHCTLFIRHARLTSQMEALGIPYVEEVGTSPSSNLWFRFPFSRCDTWQYICLRLGGPRSLSWDVKINDFYYNDLWKLQKGSNATPWGSGVQIANTYDMDSHISYDSEGVILSYKSVDADSIKKLLVDLQRLSNARTFALKMRELLGDRIDEKSDRSSAGLYSKSTAALKTVTECYVKFPDQKRGAFRIEAVGLMSLWFSFDSGVFARFVVKWESGKECCRMHVSPDQLWPHTKFLEDFINEGEVASLLDCIRLTAGPLHALVAATRPSQAALASGVSGITASISPTLEQTACVQSQGLPTNSNRTIQGSDVPEGDPTGSRSTAIHNSPARFAALAAASHRGGPGIVPHSLLPVDVSVVLRGPYWIRIIYRKKIAVDMRCFADDQVWLQPVTPPKVGVPVGEFLPFPQFSSFILEHVAKELNVVDTNFPAPHQALGISNLKLSVSTGNRVSLLNNASMSQGGNELTALNQVGNSVSAQPNLPMVDSLRRIPGSGVPDRVRGELNAAIIGLGDDGGWVHLVALKKVLSGILRNLGVLWLFWQMLNLLKEILGSVLKENEGAILNLDQELPALRFFVRGYVFAVSVHRVQLILQVVSIKSFHHSQQQQQNSVPAQEELTQSEIAELCDYFNRRVASEPYSASRVASFITLLTLPISVLKDFIKFFMWKKGLGQGLASKSDPAKKTRIELCLENHIGFNQDRIFDNSSSTKSNIHYDRANNSVELALTIVFDLPLVESADSAAWLPYCVSVRLRFSFGEDPEVSFLGMEGSHGGRACWFRDEWEKHKQCVMWTVKIGSACGNSKQGWLKVVADCVLRTLLLCLEEPPVGG